MQLSVDQWPSDHPDYQDTRSDPLPTPCPWVDRMIPVTLDNGQEVKLKVKSYLPEQDTKMDEQDTKMNEQDTKKEAQLICEKCGGPVEEKDKACRTCGQYRPGPDETFDCSKVNFTLPTMLASRYRPSKRAENRHELPFPCAPGEDLSQSREANEWILNHLPLKEEEKKQFLDELLQKYYADRKEITIQTRKEKRKQETEESRKAIFSRHQEPRPSSTSSRLGNRRRDRLGVKQSS